MTKFTPSFQTAPFMIGFQFSTLQGALHTFYVTKKLINLTVLISQGLELHARLEDSQLVHGL